MCFLMTCFTTLITFLQNVLSSQMLYNIIHCFIALISFLQKCPFTKSFIEL